MSNEVQPLLSSHGELNRLEIQQKKKSRTLLFSALFIAILGVVAVVGVLSQSTSSSSSENSASTSEALTMGLLGNQRSVALVSSSSNKRDGRYALSAESEYSVLVIPTCHASMLLENTDEIHCTMTSSDMFYLITADNENAKRQASAFSGTTNTQLMRVGNTDSYILTVSSQISALELRTVLDTNLSSCERMMLSEYRQASTSVSREEGSEEFQLNLHADNSTNEVKNSIVDNLDATYYMESLSRMSGNESTNIYGSDGASTSDILTRYSFNATQNYLSAQFFAQELTRLGVDEVIWQEFTLPENITTYNVIGVVNGAVYPDEIFVVGGHIDSRAETSDLSMVTAPGAVDNGSGTSAVLAIAEAFRGLTPQRTVHFIAFSGEEQGMLGSMYYCEQAVEQGLNIVGAEITDMIGYSHQYYGVTVEGTEDEEIVELMDIMIANLETYSPKLEINLHYYSYGSDHVSFQVHGYPAFLAIEEDDCNYPYYHTTADTIDNINQDQAMDITRALAATLYDCAY